MRIMVVEDHPKMMEIAVRILQILGFKDVVSATSVDDALLKLSNIHLDLIICDYHLSGRDGLDLHKTMMQRPVWADISFILITADQDLDPVIKAARQGVKMLNKPFTPKSLADTLQDLMGTDIFSQAH